MTTALDPGPMPCACAAGPWRHQYVLPLPALDDEEGAALPNALPAVVDAHVHLFPDRLFEAVWAWFDRYGWPIRYRLHAKEVLAFLFARGVSQVVGMAYAHKPGVARVLNPFLAELAREEPRLCALGTVYPGEAGAKEIVDEAFASGLSGLKLHCHVQGIGPDDPAMATVYDACSRAGKPLVLHAGREPSSPAYPRDPWTFCSVERVEQVLRSWPTLKLCVPHLGADEFDGYARLLERHDNLWLDTTMAISGYFPGEVPAQLLRVRPERILYGTDFPNLPYAWDREVKQLLGFKLSEPDLARVLHGSAAELFRLLPSS